jgi:DNA-binding CsgD family transcriptional regulator
MMADGFRPRLNIPFDSALSTTMAKAVGALGADSFYEAMMDLLGEVSPWDEGGALIFYRDHRPYRFFQRYDPTARTFPKDYYLEGPYALDPLYDLFLKGAATGVYHVGDIAPDEFFQSEFYRVFYSQIGLIDYVNVMWRIDADSAFIFYLERSLKHPMFQTEDLAALRLMLPFVVAITQRHYELINAGAGLDVDRITHQKVQCAMESFGSSVLTRREREVLLFMLKGFSTAMTAEQIKTSEDTVKMHRKNIHRKLDIGSQAALFSLFINCIGYADPEAKADPLVAYQSKPARPSRQAHR